jgi:hypothetical protein
LGLHEVTVISKIIHLNAAKLIVCFLYQVTFSGGARSSLSPTFGMPADILPPLSVATANGDLVTTNSCQNSDLFWALRGVVASTYGVIYNVTYQTHELDIRDGCFIECVVKRCQLSGCDSAKPE